MVRGKIRVGKGLLRSDSLLRVEHQHVLQKIDGYFLSVVGLSYGRGKAYRLAQHS